MGDRFRLAENVELVGELLHFESAVLPSAVRYLAYLDLLCAVEVGRYV